MNYMPIVRTRAAELKGFRELSDDVHRSIFPLIELTRSRRSSRNPGGDIQRSIDAIGEILADRPFVADLTSLASQQNSEFNQLLDDTDAFRNWTNFARDRLPPTCVPIVHLTDPFEESDFAPQVERLLEQFTRVAVRVPTSYTELPEIISTLEAVLGSLQDVVFILDAGYVTAKSLSGAYGRLSEMLAELAGKNPNWLSVASSSFPSSVTSVGGGDDEGELELHEVTLGNALLRVRSDLRYSDYAAIYPMDFSGTVVNWVPRVDVMLDEKFYYYRYRRTAGGYPLAAAEARRDPRWVSLDCWAQDNINAAAAGNPNGMSPSFWIANRVNFHISRQVSRLTR